MTAPTVVPTTWLDAYFTPGYKIIVSGATTFPPELILDFEGTGVSIADDPVHGKTVATITAGGLGVAHTTASFTQPAVGSNVTVPVDTTAMLTAGVTVYVAGGGWYTVASVTDSTHFVATNLGISGNAAPTSTIASASLVVPSGPTSVSGYGVPIVSSGGTLTLTALQRWGLFIAGDVVTVPAVLPAGLDFLLTHDQIRSTTSLAGTPVTIQRGGGAYVIMQPDGHKTGGGAPVTGSSVNGFTDGANYRFAFDGGSPGVLRCINSLSSP